MQHIGIDIIEIERIKRAITRRGETFLKRVYTGQELDLYRKKPASLAARFAGKEAVIKTLQARGVDLREIEILSEPDGRPQVKLYGRAKKQADELGLAHLAISLSHSREYAVAFVIGEAE
jgi:holo-[acyl-carrier protein] synthase